jgi:translation initiation factor IF-1
MFGSVQKVVIFHLRWHSNMSGEMRKMTVWLWTGGDCVLIETLSYTEAVQR